MERYDAIIIGFGKGGKTLAVDLANRNWKVALIEKSSQMYGGTCINIGCIPTKTLVHKAKDAVGRGLTAYTDKQHFYEDAMSYKKQLVEFLRNKNYNNLASNKNITIYNGNASFLGPDEVLVTQKDGTVRLVSDKIFINTGSDSVIPDIPGIADNPYVYTSTSLLDLPSLPEKLIIIGGGYIGLEFASIYASFGSKITVLEGNERLLPREDEDVAEAVKSVLEKRGVHFEFNVKVTSVDEKDGRVQVNWFDKQTKESALYEGTAILLATGRKPRTDDLNLSAAGIDVDKHGAIKVDQHLVTTNPNVRALGDVRGGLQFTYLSLDDYRIVIDDLFGTGKRNTADRYPISFSVFIDPPLSRVGMNQLDAEEAELSYRIKTIPVQAIPRAHTLEEVDGLLKAVVEKNTDRILGCILFCPESNEVINIVAMAMKMGVKATYLHEFIFTHPSMSEALNDLFS